MTTTPDQMTPEHETSTPAEDHPSTSTTKITEPITPWHLRSFGILVGAGAPPVKINTGLVGPERTADGASC